MPSAAETTVEKVLHATSWDQRVAQIRLIPERHGTAEHQAIYATIAKKAYVPHLAPDFAYVPAQPFYEAAVFVAAYDEAKLLTDGFTQVTVDHLVEVLRKAPRTLLAFRTITGLIPGEFASTSKLVAEMTGSKPVSKSRVDSMERKGTIPSPAVAQIVAQTLDAIMNGLYNEPPPGLKSKQDKADTEAGWESVRAFASGGVPYSLFLHQRHFGGTFSQLINATSSKRGDVVEGLVEQLFIANAVPYIRTGSHHQADIAARFEVTVTPAPDFVVFDPRSDALRGMLECKATNDGGTARDKALRFRTLRTECTRLGGVPLFGILAGLGWARTNDTLGPVVRDTDGRVFSPANLDEILTVHPFPDLLGLIDS